MGDVSYKQAHQIICGSIKASSRLSLTDSCVHGYIACGVSTGVLLFNINRYLNATGSCTLRKDKALPEYSPDCQVTCVDPVHWVAFNSDGLVLAVVTSNEMQGTFVHLISLVELLKRGSTQLSSISRSIRVCGGEPLTATGQPGWEVRDFAWSPASPNVFVLILNSGSVRLFSASPDISAESVSLVGQLQAGVDAQCLSWSGKGKQLAICLNGTLPITNGVVQGPLILQVDPQLKVKRTVALNSMLAQLGDGGNNPCPLDLHWVSPACFILGLRCGSSLRAILVNAPTKSTIVTYTELPELRGIVSEPHYQYYFCPVGSQHFLATNSTGEELLLYHNNPQSSTIEGPPTAPTSILSMELPADGSPIGLTLGFHFENPQSSQPQAYAVVRLTNGNFSPFLLHIPAILDTVQPNLPKPIELPMPPSAEAPTPAPTYNGSTGTSNHSLLATTASSIPVVPAPTPISTPATGSLFSMPPAPPKPTFVPPTTKPAKDAPVHTSQPTSFPVAETRQPPISEPPTVPVSRAPSSRVKSPPRVANLPHSVQIAATQFTAALKAEADAGRTAWTELFELLKRGSHSDSKEAASTGVDVIEARLHDVDVFIKVMDEVLNEFQTSTKNRKREFMNSQIYAEKVRQAFRLCASEAMIPALTSQLDPEASRLLNRLKHRSQLVETTLFDLDAQLDALSAELENRRKSKRSVTKIVAQVDSKGDESLSMKKLIGTIDTTGQLIRTERGRIEHLMESLQRIRLASSSTNGSGLLSPSGRSGTPSSVGKHRGGTSWRAGSPSVNGSAPSPAYQSLTQRDRALYRLFSNHTLSVVHAPNVLPAIDTDTEEERFEFEPADEPELPSTPVARNKPTHFQQTKLEQLVGFSGEVASTNSPPPRAPGLFTPKQSDPIVFSPNVRPCVVTNTTTTSPLPRIHVVSSPQPTETQPASKPLFTSSTVTPAPTFSPPPSVSNARSSELPTTTSVLPTTCQSPSTGLFVLGQKFTLPASPVVVTQKSSSPAAFQPTAVLTPVTPLVTTTPTSATTTSPTISMGIFGRPIVSAVSSTAEIKSSVSPPFGTTTTTPNFTGLGVTSPVTPLTSTAQPTTLTTSGGVSTAASTFPLLSTPSTGKLFGQPTTPMNVTTASVFSPIFTPSTIAATTSVSTTVTGASLFSTAPTTSTPPTTTKSPFSFGTLGQTAHTTTVASAGSTGTVTSPFGGLFGTSAVQSVPTTPPSGTQTSSLFGAPAFATSPSNFFGGLGKTTVSNTTSVAGISQPNAAQTSTAGGTLFGSAFGTGGLFSAQTTTTVTTNATTLVTTTSAPGIGGGLFSSMAALATSTIAPTMTTSGGGLFQFNQTTPTGGLFGAATTTQQPTSGGLFGFAAAAPKPAFAGTTTTTASATTTQGGLFGSLATGQPSVTSGGGLFGAASTTQSKDVSGLFSGSAFGLGSPAPANQNPVQNVFGRSTTSGFGGGQGLFGKATPQTGTNLFGAPAFGATSTATTTAPSLFGSTTGGGGGGLFGSIQPSSSPPGAFGARPVFGQSAFGSSGQTAFGAGGTSAFGSIPSTGLFGATSTLNTSPINPSGSLFGGTNTAGSTTGGGGLFAALAEKSGSPSFGNLAMGSPPQAAAAPASPFGASPSFTQRRA